MLQNRIFYYLLFIIVFILLLLVGNFWKTDYVFVRSEAPTQKGAYDIPSSSFYAPRPNIFIYGGMAVWYVKNNISEFTHESLWSGTMAFEPECEAGRGCNFDFFDFKKDFPLLERRIIELKKYSKYKDTLLFSDPIDYKIIVYCLIFLYWIIISFVISSIVFMYRKNKKAPDGDGTS